MKQKILYSASQNIETMAQDLAIPELFSFEEARLAYGLFNVDYTVIKYFKITIEEIA